MHNQILRQENRTEGNLVSRSVIDFQIRNGLVVPVVFDNYPDGSERVRVSYDYDGFGNVVEVVKEDDKPTAFIYGYNNALPVVKAEGADYLTLKSAYDALTGDLTALRNHSTLSDALITTYTYHPVYDSHQSPIPTALSLHMIMMILVGYVLLKITMAI